jgi:ERCC4 domain
VHEQQGILLYSILFRLPHVPLAYAAGIQRIEPARSEQYADTPQTYHGLLPETNELGTRIQSSLLSPLKARNRTTDPIRSLPPHASNFNAIQRTASTTSATSSLSRPNAPRRQSQSFAIDNDDRDDNPIGDLFSSPLSSQFQRQPEALSTNIPLLKWPARTYDIICLIDTREMKDAKSRDYISDELRIRGVQVERRPLQLGDALWIARRKTAYRKEEDVDSGEVVLDFVVERKRLDDLVSRQVPPPAKARS